MKFIATSDWHLGNLFHGTDRLPEHRHFLKWLIRQIGEHQPDALLVAGDVFDNGNPSAAAQSAYYGFLADATEACPGMTVIITAGNHDSANRLEAPRPMLERHNIEIRGTVRRTWRCAADGDDLRGTWATDYDDLIIPVDAADGSRMAVLAVPFLRSDIIQDASYEQGVRRFMTELTARARGLHAGLPLVMMAHMYARGADIAGNDASERVVVGGQEMVGIDGWEPRPDYMTCGHIHKRQHIGSGGWARYTGSPLPMSFAEKDYRHGCDLVSIGGDGSHHTEFLEYTPQHRLRVLPDTDGALSPKKLARLIESELDDRHGDKPGDNYDYVVLRVDGEKASADDISRLEKLVDTKNAVLCKTLRIMPQLDITTISGNQTIESVDDILNRNPLDTLREAFAIRHGTPLSKHQEAMLSDIIDRLNRQEEP